jgi:hypothetical protein
MQTVPAGNWLKACLVLKVGALYEGAVVIVAFFDCPVFGRVLAGKAAGVVEFKGEVTHFLCF